MKVAYVNTGYGEMIIESERLREAGFELAVYEGLRNDEIVSTVGDADALVVALEKVTADIINGLPSLKVIGRMGVGTDSLDLEAASRRGIPVINVPDYCIEEVALHAVSLMLAAHRKLLPACRLVEQGLWHRSADLKPVQALSKLTLGLIGMGRIGAMVVRFMQAMVGRILVYDPYLDPGRLPEGVESANLERLWSESDILSVHCPLTAETKHLIDRNAFSRMTKRPIIVNVSRGSIINENDLLDALDSGAVRYAALDVLEQEPPPSHHPLLRHPNVLITNHFAWYSAESELRLRELSVTRVIDYLKGRPVPTIVNRDSLEAS
jgi:D-3-phosphoglycerate dehydrogenase